MGDKLQSRETMLLGLAKEGAMGDKPTPEERAAKALPCSCSSRYRRDFVEHAMQCPAKHIEAAAAAIRAAADAARTEEREACATLCEDHTYMRDISWWMETPKREISADAARECARAIRARGTEEDPING